MRLLIWGQRSGYTIDLGESKQKIILMPVYVYFSVLFSETKNVVFVFVLRR